MNELSRILLVAGLGLALGSFLNVVAFRLPQGWSVFFGSVRSHCRHCQAVIGWYDNIPLLSFLYLRGRCRRCRQSISWQYPLVELMMAAIALCAYWQYSLTVYFSKYLALGFFLLGAAVIDWQTRKIPDALIIAGIIAGIFFAFYTPFPGWQYSLISLGLGFFVPLLVVSCYELVRGKIIMGGGDIKLMAMIALFLGWQRLAPVIFYGAFAGLLTALLLRAKGKKGPLPFAPFLALGSALVLWSPDWLQIWGAE